MKNVVKLTFDNLCAMVSRERVDANCTGQWFGAVIVWAVGVTALFVVQALDYAEYKAKCIKCNVTWQKALDDVREEQGRLRGSIGSVETYARWVNRVDADQIDKLTKRVEVLERPKCCRPEIWNGSKVD